MATSKHNHGGQAAAANERPCAQLAHAAADFSAAFTARTNPFFTANGTQLLRLGGSRSGTRELHTARDHAIALASDHGADLDDLADLFSVTARTARAAAERGRMTPGYRIVRQAFRPPPVRPRA